MLKKVDEVHSRGDKLIQLVVSAELGPIPEPQSISLFSIFRPARLYNLLSPNGQSSNLGPSCPVSSQATNFVLFSLLLTGRQSDSPNSTTVFQETGSLIGIWIASLRALGNHTAAVLHGVISMNLEFLED